MKLRSRGRFLTFPLFISAGPWWGKAVGALVGVALGGLPGLLVGLMLGHIFDQQLRLLPYSPQSWQGVPISPGERDFLTATFSMMGCIAKADGRVSEAEVEAARRIMDRLGLDEGRRQRAIQLFNRGKRRDFPRRAVLRRFNAGPGRYSDSLERFLRCILEVAYADGQPAPGQQRLLRKMARQLGVSETRLEELARTRDDGRRSGPQRPPEPAAPLREAYELLGVSQGASAEEVKRAYRRALSKHHPDRLLASGASEPEIKEASTRTQEICRAFEAIRQAQGF